MSAATSSVATRNCLVASAVICLLITLTLALFSMFYVGWIRYTVTPPPTPSADFRANYGTKFIYNTRIRGLFFQMVENPNADVVKDNNNNQYFPVMYNNSTAPPSSTSVGFWSITAIMKASVGLHVSYMVTTALAAWLVAFSVCLGRCVSYLAAAALVLGLVGAVIGLGLFHIYLEMERSMDIEALPDIYFHWTMELQDATTETFYVSYGIYIGSFGCSLLSLILIGVVLSSWTSSAKDDDDITTSDKANMYTRDNLAYNDNMMDKPARAELWLGFDRVSDKRVDRMLANYPTDDKGGHNHQPYNGQLYNGQPYNGQPYNLPHHAMSERSGDPERLNTPTHLHYHSDQTNFPIRY